MVNMLIPQINKSTALNKVLLLTLSSKGKPSVQEEPFQSPTGYEDESHTSWAMNKGMIYIHDKAEI